VSIDRHHKIGVVLVGVVGPGCNALSEGVQRVEAVNHPRADLPAVPHLDVRPRHEEAARVHHQSAHLPQQPPQKPQQHQHSQQQRARDELDHPDYHPHHEDHQRYHDVLSRALSAQQALHVYYKYAESRGGAAALPLDPQRMATTVGLAVRNGYHIEDEVPHRALEVLPDRRGDRQHTELTAGADTGANTRPRVVWPFNVLAEITQPPQFRHQHAVHLPPPRSHHRIALRR